MGRFAVATLTVRNLPDDAKHRFRQIAAAHGRSMEEHLRQMVINAEPASKPAFQGVHDVAQTFKHEPADLAQQSKAARDADHAARIRAMSSKEFIDHLIATAAGVGLELPKRTVSKGREIFGAD
jgi:plasmid stability protein